MGSSASKSTKVVKVKDGVEGGRAANAQKEQQNDDDVVVVSRLSKMQDSTHNNGDASSGDKRNGENSSNVGGMKPTISISGNISKNMHRAEGAKQKNPLVDRQGSIQAGLGSNPLSQRSSKASLAPPGPQETTEPKAHFPGTEPPKTEDELLLETIDKKVEAKAKHDTLTPAAALSPPQPKSAVAGNKSGINVNVRDIDNAMDEIGGSIASINSESEHTLTGLQRRPQMNFDPEKFREANNAANAGAVTTAQLRRNFSDDDEAFAESSSEFQFETGGALGDKVTANPDTSDKDSLDIGLDELDERLMQEIEAGLTRTL